MLTYSCLTLHGGLKNVPVRCCSWPDFITQVCTVYSLSSTLYLTSYLIYLLFNFILLILNLTLHGSTVYSSYLTHTKFIPQKLRSYSSSDLYSSISYLLSSSPHSFLLTHSLPRPSHLINTHSPPHSSLFPIHIRSKPMKFDIHPCSPLRHLRKFLLTGRSHRIPFISDPTPFITVIKDSEARTTQDVTPTWNIKD